MANKVDRKKLIKTIEDVMVGVGGKSAAEEIIDEMSYVFFDGGRLITFNDSICVSSKTDVFESKSVFAVSVVEFLSFLKKAKTKEIDLEIREDEIYVIAGKTEAGFKKMEYGFLKEMAEEMDFDSPKGWNEIPDGFEHFLSLALFSTSSDKKSLLSGVHIFGDTLESTDDDTITICYFNEGVNMIEILIPSEVIPRIVKYTFDSYKVTNTWLYLKTKTDGLVIAARLLDGADKYPDIVKYTEFDGDELDVPAEIAEAMDTSSIMANTDENDKSIKFFFTNSKLIVSSENQAGWVKTEIDSLWDSDDLEFSTNPNFIKRVLPLVDYIKVSPDCILLSNNKNTFIHAIALTN